MYKKGALVGWLTTSQTLLFAYVRAELDTVARRQSNSNPGDDNGTPSSPPIFFPEQCQDSCSSAGGAALCDASVQSQIVQCYQCLVQAGTFTQEAADEELNKLLGSCSTSGSVTPSATSSPPDGGSDPGGNGSSNPNTDSAGSTLSPIPTMPTVTGTGPSSVPGGGGNGDSGESGSGNGASNENTTAGSTAASTNSTHKLRVEDGVMTNTILLILMFAGTGLIKLF